MGPLALIILPFAPVPFSIYLIIFGTILAIFGVLALIFGVFTALRYFLDKIYEKFEVEDYDQCKYDVLIGLGIMTICGLVPRILVYFVEPSLLLLYYSAIIYPLTWFMLHFFFFLEMDVTYQIDPTSGTTIFFGGLIFHILLLIGTIRIGTFYTVDDIKALIITCQVWFGIFFGTSSTEFLLVLSSGLVSIQNNKVELKSVKVVKSIPEVEEREIVPKIECKICLLEYSNTQIPRILTECGHTVCQTCADNILKKGNGRVLKCPFCQVITVANGPAQNLARNYAVWNFIQEVEKN